MSVLRGRNVAAGVVLAVALAGCGGKDTQPHSDAPPIQAHAIEVHPQKVPETYDVVGTVRPKVSATVAAKLTAVIQTIAVKPGDVVTAGAPLAQLDDREARAEFERAQSEFGRSKSLLEKEAATRAEFDAVEARYRVAKANLSYTSITAPFDGIVAEKLCDAGDLATPGKPLFRVEQPTDFRLEAFVPERFSTAVQVGTIVHVMIEAVGDECEGIVGEVIPVTDPATRSFLVKVDLRSDKSLKSGMFGRAQIVVGGRTGFFVPTSAVRERGQLTFVYVLNEGRAHMRLVTTGKTTGEQIEILSGAQGGDKVIVTANSELADGRRISSF